MPPAVWPRARPPEIPGVGQAKRHRPATNHLIRYVDPPLSEHIFDIAKAQRKAEIQPDGMLDDQGRETVAGIGNILHPTTIPGHQHRGHSVYVTTPSNAPRLTAPRSVVLQKSDDLRAPHKSACAWCTHHRWSRLRRRTSIRLTRNTWLPRQCAMGRSGRRSAWRPQPPEGVPH